MGGRAQSRRTTMFSSRVNPGEKKKLKKHVQWDREKQRVFERKAARQIRCIKKSDFYLCWMSLKHKIRWGLENLSFDVAMWKRSWEGMNVWNPWYWDYRRVVIAGKCPEWEEMMGGKMVEYEEVKKLIGQVIRCLCTGL